MNTKKFLSLFPLVSLFLVFMTWQGITIFTLGYSLKEKEEKLRSEEIHYQNLLNEYRIMAGLNKIDAEATGKLGMKLPSSGDIRVVKLNREKLYLRPSGEALSLLSYIREVLQTSQLQSKR